MRITNISEAKASLSKLVERAARGEEVIIGKAGKPVAKLIGIEDDRRPRDLDQAIWRDRLWMADDFDELPEDLQRAFEGDDADEPPP